MWQENEDSRGQETLLICIALSLFLSLVPPPWILPVLVGSYVGLVAVGSKILSVWYRRTILRAIPHAGKRERFHCSLRHHYGGDGNPADVSRPGYTQSSASATIIASGR